MADVKITALPAVPSAVASTDVLPLVQNVSTTPVTRKSTISQLSTAIYADNAGFTGLTNATSVSGTDTTLVAQSGNNREATVSQVATAVLADNTAITALPNASSVTVTNTTVVAQSGTNREATIAQISAAVYADNTALVGLPNVTSVANSDTLVVAQSGTNREATMTQVGTNVWANTAAAGTLGAGAGAILSLTSGSQIVGSNTTYPIGFTNTFTNNSLVFANQRPDSRRLQWSSTGLIGTCLAVPLNTPATYAISYIKADNYIYTDMYVIIQSSRTNAAGGGQAALPTVGTYARIQITAAQNYPTDNSYMVYDLLNFNGATYNSLGTPTFKVPLKFTRGSAYGTAGNSTATATGSITGNIMTVTVGPTGTSPRIVPGATVTGTSVVTGTKVVEQLTDTSGVANGGAGTYLVNTAQTVTSTTLTCTGVDSSMMGLQVDTNFDSGGSQYLIVEITATNYTGGTIDILLYGNQQVYRGAV